MRKNREITLIFAVLAVCFAGIFAVPMITGLGSSFPGVGTTVSLRHDGELLTGGAFPRAVG